MVRFSISEFSTYRWSLEQEVKELSRRGIQNIGIWRTKFADYDLEYAADLLYLNDLKVSSLSWAGGFTGGCGMSHDFAIEDGIAAIRTAAKIGADCLIVHPGRRNGHTRRHACRLFSLAIEQMIPVASDFGVTLTMEVMGREEADQWTVFDTQMEAVDFACQYSPNELGLVVDLFHTGTNPLIYERISNLISRVALVQISDRITKGDTAYRCQPGTGELPVQQWYNMLEDNGYRGMYEMELFGPNFGELRYRHMLDQSAECFRRLESRKLHTTASS